MDVALVVGAVSEDSPWLRDCLASLEGCDWPVVPHITRDWELSSIGWAADHFDEFVYIPESTIVLDPSFLDRCFTDYPRSSVNLGTAQGMKYRMYLGKYRSGPVKAVGVPRVDSKMSAIYYEIHWCSKYERADRFVSIGGPLEHTETFEERHGRLNMVVENEYLRRYKGSWGQQQ